MAESKSINLPTGESVEKTGKGVLFTSVAFLLAAGTIWGIKKLRQANREQDRQDEVFEDIFTVGQPAYYANRLLTAIQGWGTDEEEIMRVFNEIPTKAFYNRVFNSYSALTKGDNLNEDLKDDLSTDELAQAMEILNSKP